MGSIDDWLDKEICKISQHGTCEKETHYNKEYDGTMYCTQEDPRFPCRYQTVKRQFVLLPGDHCGYMRPCTNPRYEVNKDEHSD